MTHTNAYYGVNAITMSRLVMAPVMIILLFREHIAVFGWMLALSYCADVLDGWLARKYKVTSLFGVRLDLIGDYLTIVAGTIGVMVNDPLFFISRIIPVGVILGLLLLQLLLSLIRFQKFASFPTYLSRAAAVSRCGFFLCFYFKPDMAWLFFDIAFAATALAILEEIVLVLILPRWQENVRGIWWQRSSKVNTLH